MRFLIEDGVPSIKTAIGLPSGTHIELYGLHPEPPPLQNTAGRDADCSSLDGESAKGALPSVVVGDLNDVAWSRCNRLLQEVSGLLDQRIGWGPHAAFNTDWPLLRWPLDHVFFEERLQEIAVMENIGSDRFSLFVALCHDPATDDIQDPPQSEHPESAEEAIAEGPRKGSGMSKRIPLWPMANEATTTTHRLVSPSPLVRAGPAWVVRIPACKEPRALRGGRGTPRRCVPAVSGSGAPNGHIRWPTCRRQPRPMPRCPRRPRRPRHGRHPPRSPRPPRPECSPGCQRSRSG